MGENTETREKKKYYNLVSKAEDVDKVNNRVIARVEKVGNEYQKVAWIKSLSGWITHAEIGQIKWKTKAGKEKVDPKFALELRDANGIYHLEFTCNNTSYGLINSLLAADFTREIEIKGYVQKSGFVGASAKYPGDKDDIAWKIPVPALPKPIEFEHPITHAKEKSYKNVEDFWLEEFKNIKFKAVMSNLPSNLPPKESDALRNLEATKSDLNPPERKGIDFKSITTRISGNTDKDSWPTTPPPVNDDDDLDNLPF